MSYRVGATGDGTQRIGDRDNQSHGADEAHDAPKDPMFKKQLDAYESFAMTLVFEKAGSVVVEVMVEEAEAQPKPH